MSVQSRWRHEGINEWVDSNLLDNSSYYQHLRDLVEQGELAKAFEVANNHPNADIVSFRVAALRRKVFKTLEAITSWQTALDQPLVIVEPNDWFEIPRYNVVLEIIEGYIKEVGNTVDSLLDIGCYTGYFVRELQSRLVVPRALAYYACDIQKALIDYLNLKYKDLPTCPAVRYFVHNAEQRQQRKYRIISMLEVLTHTLEPVAALDASLDALEEGGLLVVTTSTPTTGRCKDRERLRSYSPEQLVALVRERYEVVYKKPLGNNAWVKKIYSEYQQPETVLWVTR